MFPTFDAGGCTSSATTARRVPASEGGIVCGGCGLSGAEFREFREFSLEAEGMIEV